MNRQQYPQRDFDLQQRNGDDETWEQSAAYETAYQLARIANALESMLVVKEEEAEADNYERRREEA